MTVIHLLLRTHVRWAHGKWPWLPCCQQVLWVQVLCQVTRFRNIKLEGKVLKTFCQKYSIIKFTVLKHMTWVFFFFLSCLNLLQLPSRWGRKSYRKIEKKNWTFFFKDGTIENVDRIVNEFVACFFFVLDLLALYHFLFQNSIWRKRFKYRTIYWFSSTRLRSTEIDIQNVNKHINNFSYDCESCILSLFVT